MFSEHGERSEFSVFEGYLHEFLNVLTMLNKLSQHEQISQLYIDILCN